MRWFVLVAALVLLDVSLTFENVWPTPAVFWRGALSMELAVVLIGLLLARRWVASAHRPLLAVLSALWTALAIGRYADVTAPALYGRGVNLYWDLRFIPDVVAMVTRVAPLRLVVLAAAAIAVVLAGVYWVMRWAWRRIAAATMSPQERQLVLAISCAAFALFIAQRAGVRVPGRPVFAHPVSATYFRQARFVAEALAGSTSLADSPSMDSDLSRVKGADVFLIFVEAYGAVTYERPDIARPLDASRAELAAAIRETRREAVSAYVESPTFGGASWLAHLSLLSGIEVHDPDTNAKLMAARRDTLVRAFGRGGFRTVALMPGLRQNWPEGSFYGFDEIYGADRLAYAGPEFGWFAIPDQFSLLRIDALEVRRAPRPPLFVFFPTISTHFPFSPTPPYQPDWRRMTLPRPYDGPQIVKAYARQPDWVHFSPGYVEAMAYDFASIAGYLREQPDRDLVMIVLGDHQPAAAVSGEGAPWTVPVHVIAARAGLLDRLRGRGFGSGLTPRRPAIGRMNELLPVLLDAFGDRR